MITSGTVHPQCVLIRKIPRKQNAGISDLTMQNLLQTQDPLTLLVIGK